MAILRIYSHSTAIYAGLFMMRLSRIEGYKQLPRHQTRKLNSRKKGLVDGNCRAGSLNSRVGCVGGRDGLVSFGL